ncbi:VanZ family protein [Bacillus benzoevorans]|uniref:VanZ family protein n=1 Tax=Bacillus benzoevorans TaxID=1456 RepID=UPI0016083E25
MFSARYSGNVSFEQPGDTSIQRIGLALFLCVLYAIFDEIPQIFSPQGAGFS